MPVFSIRGKFSIRRKGLVPLPLCPHRYDAGVAPRVDLRCAEVCEAKGTIIRQRNRCISTDMQRSWPALRRQAYTAEISDSCRSMAGSAWTSNGLLCLSDLLRGLDPSTHCVAQQVFFCWNAQISVSICLQQQPPKKLVHTIHACLGETRILCETCHRNGSSRRCSR